MRSSSLRTVERARPLLGTVVAVRAEGHAATVEAAVERAFDAIADVQRCMSFHDPDSELSRLNREAAHAPQAVCASLWRVLRAALAVARASDGRFDPSVGWRMVRRRQLPAPAGAGEVADDASWRDIELGSARTVHFRKPLWLDLGGIAKGHAVDRAVAVLRAAGMGEGIVNAGGDLRAFGHTVETIRVRDPASPASTKPMLALREGAVATSAGYFSTGVAGSALLDGRGGDIADDASATVCAPRAIWADALTKVVLADPDAALPLLRRLGAQAMLLHADGRTRRLH